MGRLIDTPGFGTVVRQFNHDDRVELTIHGVTVGYITLLRATKGRAKIAMSFGKQVIIERKQAECTNETDSTDSNACATPSPGRASARSSSPSATASGGGGDAVQR